MGSAAPDEAVAGDHHLFDVTFPFPQEARADAELRGRFVLDGAGNARLDLGGEAVELTAQCRVGTAAYTFIEGVEQGQQDQIAKAG